MIALVLIYCLAGQPDQCVEDRPAVGDLATPIACFRAAEIVAASEEQRLEMAHLHPGYAFSGFRCGPRREGV